MDTGIPPPHRFRFVDEGKTLLAADWRDGHVSVFPLAYLRGWCPCAGCQGHSGRPGWVEPPADGLRLTAIQPVGAYAIALAWSDGHGTGIHPFEALRNMCPCEGCGGATAGTPEAVTALCARVNAAG